MIYIGTNNKKFIAESLIKNNSGWLVIKNTLEVIEQPTAEEASAICKICTTESKDAYTMASYLKKVLTLSNINENNTQSIEVYINVKNFIKKFKEDTLKMCPNMIGYYGTGLYNRFISSLTSFVGRYKEEAIWQK